MAIEIREVRSRKDKLEFIRLPYLLYQRHPNWLPPIFSDEKKFYDPERNTAFSVSDTIRFLAFRDGKVTGRIMGVIHHPFNRDHQEKTGRFCSFDLEEDGETAQALLSAVETWCRGKGMDQVIGPFAFSDKDPQGMLISGFGHRGILTAPYNFPYYPELVAANGYEKMVDLVEYLIPVPDEMPELYKKLTPRILSHPGLRCVEFRSKKELKPYIVPVLKLMCETFSEIYGSVVLSEQEMKKLAAEYLPVLDPDFIKVVEVDGDPVAFILGMPDIGPGLQKARGRLFPFGFLHILRELKKTRYLVLFLGGIRKSYQGKGLDVLMGTRMIETCQRRGYKEINSHLELETNVKVRAEMERAGGEIYKTYRIYRKTL